MSANEKSAADGQRFDPGQSMEQRSLFVARVLGAAAFVGGLAGFLGWTLDVNRLADWDGSGVAMQPNTTVCVMLAGVGVALLAGGWQKLGALLGLAAGVIGAATLSQHLLHIDLGIDGVLTFGRTWGQALTVSPGRMGLPASLSWTLLGCGFLILAAGRERRLVPGFALAVIFIAGISFIGYLYGANMLYALPRWTAIAWQTSGVLIVIAVGLLAANPDLKPTSLFVGEGVTGMLLRRVTVPVILLPLLLGLLRVAGQNAGYYDTAQGSAMINVILITLMLAGLALIGKQALQFEHHATEAEIAKSRVSTLSRMMTAQEDERRRIAAELHDELGQHMTALRLQVHAISDHATDDRVRSDVKSLAETAEAIDLGLDGIIKALRPVALDALGLTEAIDQYITIWPKLTGISARFYSSGYRQGMLTHEAETAVYRIMQEALHNCAKHSGAANVSAVLTKRGDSITLAIEDDGSGFVEGLAGSGLGLISMRERAELVGGTLVVESDGTSGTTVIVTVPVTEKLIDSG